MSLVSKEEFSNLAQFNNNICLSIFIPTTRAGKEVLEEKHSLHLKSQWTQAKKRLTAQGISGERIEVLGKPIVKLIDDKEFWRHQSDGLAVFASEGILKKFTLPINFEAHTYIGKEFYLKPLVPIFSGKGKFFILEIQPKKVSFYEATNYSITQIDIDDLAPETLQDRVGYDYEEKHLNHKGSINTQHGYAPATRERKDEFLRFFRAVDQGINKIIHHETVPLIVACEDYLFPIYEEANTYNHLFDKCVPGNPNDNQHVLELHAKAVEQLQSHFEKQKEEKMKEFNEQPPEMTSTRITDIIPSIYEGKVDTLFLENREDIFGTYDEKNLKVNVQDEHTQENISLMNLAAKKVIEQGGSVYLLESAFMPEKDSKMNALLRYNY